VEPWSAKHVRDVKIKQMMSNSLEMNISSLKLLIIAIFIVRFKKGDSPLFPPPLEIGDSPLFVGVVKG
jgi:hypothetical protein